MSIFSLDYRTMSQALQRMRYTGSVEASVPSGAFAKGVVLLEVQRGVVQSCIVVTRDGQQVNDSKRIAEELTRAGLLEWRLTSAPGDSSERELAPAYPSFALTQEPWPHPPATFGAQVLSATSYPQHVPADPAWISTWPLIHRQVYNLSTGQYSEQDIARLLRYSPPNLLTVLNELESMGVLKRHM